MFSKIVGKKSKDINISKNVIEKIDDNLAKLVDVSVNILSKSVSDEIIDKNYKDIQDSNLKFSIQYMSDLKYDLLSHNICTKEEIEEVDRKLKQVVYKKFIKKHQNDGFFQEKFNDIKNQINSGNENQKLISIDIFDEYFNSLSDISQKIYELSDKSDKNQKIYELGTDNSIRVMQLYKQFSSRVNENFAKVFPSRFDDHKDKKEFENIFDEIYKINMEIFRNDSSSQTEKNEEEIKDDINNKVNLMHDQVKKAFDILNKIQDDQQNNAKMTMDNEFYKLKNKIHNTLNKSKGNNNFLRKKHVKVEYATDRYFNALHSIFDNNSELKNEVITKHAYDAKLLLKRGNPIKIKKENREDIKKEISNIINTSIDLVNNPNNEKLTNGRHGIAGSIISIISSLDDSKNNVDQYSIRSVLLNQVGKLEKKIFNKLAKQEHNLLHSHKNIVARKIINLQYNIKNKFNKGINKILRKKTDYHIMNKHSSILANYVNDIVDFYERDRRSNPNNRESNEYDYLLEKLSINFASLLEESRNINKALKIMKMDGEYRSEDILNQDEFYGLINESDVSEDPGYVSNDESDVSEDKRYVSDDKRYVSDDESDVSEDKSYVSDYESYVSEDAIDENKEQLVEVEFKKSKLHLAIESSDENLVEELLSRRNVDVYARDKNGATPIMVAIESSNNNKNIIQKLLDHNADLDQRDNGARTVLHYAVLHSNKEILTLLLEHCGELINENDIYGNTALHLAVKHGKNDIVNLLLDKGAYYTLSNNYGDTPLHLAAKGGHYDVVQTLLSNGVGVNIINISGKNPLHLAAKGGYNDVVQTLLSNGADVNITFNGKTPLHTAAKGGYDDVVQTLLKNGADVNMMNLNKETALFLAVRNGHYDVVQTLLSNGASVDIENKLKKTVLDIAVEYDHDTILKLLLDHKKDHKKVNIVDYVNKVDSNGDTLLMIAAKNKSYHVVNVLLNEGADVSITNKYGKNAFSIATENDCMPIIVALSSHYVVNDLSSTSEVDPENNTLLHDVAKNGSNNALQFLLKLESSDINAVNNNLETALHIAAREGNYDIVSTLLNKDANIVNKIDSNGNTALHIAIANGCDDVVELLLSYSINLNLQNKTGDTPLHIAVFNNNLNAVKLLVKRIREIDVNVKNSNGETVEDFVKNKTMDPRIKAILLYPSNIGVTKSVTLKKHTPNVQTTNVSSMISKIEDNQEIKDIMKDATSATLVPPAPPLAKFLSSTVQSGQVSSMISKIEKGNKENKDNKRSLIISEDDIINTKKSLRKTEMNANKNQGINVKSAIDKLLVKSETVKLEHARSSKGPLVPPKPSLNLNDKKSVSEMVSMFNTISQKPKSFNKIDTKSDNALNSVGGIVKRTKDGIGNQISEVLKHNKLGILNGSRFSNSVQSLSTENRQVQTEEVQKEKDVKKLTRSLSLPSLIKSQSFADLASVGKDNKPTKVDILNEKRKSNNNDDKRSR